MPHNEIKVYCNKIKIPFCRYVLVFGKRGLYAFVLINYFLTAALGV